MRDSATSVLVSALILAGTALAAPGQTIIGSKHDLRPLLSIQRVCVPCHTPHNAKGVLGSKGTGSVLWNHAETTQVFTLYDPSYPGLGRSSLQCLSCHDGVTAVDSYGGQTGTVLIQGKPAIGTDLRNDHPVGFEWTHQTQPKKCGSCHDGHNPSTIGPLRFYNSYIECATCHDPHNSTGLVKMLRVTKAGSQICLTCHSM